MRNNIFLTGNDILLVGNDTVFMRNHIFLTGNDLLLTGNDIFLMGNDKILMRNHIFLTGNDILLMENDLAHMKILFSPCRQDRFSQNYSCKIWNSFKYAPIFVENRNTEMVNRFIMY